MKARKYPVNTFFTADPHYYHRNIIQYCSRPFHDELEMAEICIEKHNANIREQDFVIMAGDFTWLKSERDVKRLISRLNGKIVFIRGNHDYWMDNRFPGFSPFKHILDIQIEGQPITVSHYAMRVWNKSHFNAWNLYGHSHGTLPPVGKQMDVGVDCNNFTPVSFEQVRDFMAKQPDNTNFIPEGKR